MWKSYLNIALRNIFKHKGYSLINVLGLAIGMACCILILLYVRDELSYDRHHEKADQTYRLAIGATIGEMRLNSAQTPSPWGPTLVADYPEVLNMVRFKTPNSAWLLKYEGKEFWEKGFFFADSTVFDIFSYSFVRGNPQTALNGPNNVVISESAARKYFGNDDPIGKVINAEDFLMLTVAGVVEDQPMNSHFHCDFLVSFSSLGPGPGSSMYGNLYNPTMQQQGLNPTIYTYLLLQEDFPPEEVENKLPAFLERYLGDQLSQRGIEARPFLQPVTDIHLHSNLDAEIEANSDILYVYIFSALALFIIVIACINFMNLATARSASRAQEVGLRKVAGAHRGQLISQFIGESVVLALLASFVASGLVYLLLPLFNGLAGKALALSNQDWTLAPVLTGIALFVGVLAGSYPAFFLSGFQPVAVLKGALKAGSSNARLRKILVVGQFTIAMIMIVGTITVYNQLEYMRNKKLGYDKEHVVTLRLANIFISQRYEASFKQAVIQHPEVLAAAGAYSLPGGPVNNITVRPFGTGEEENRTLQFLTTDYEYIETMGMEMAAGRAFSRDFGTDTQTSVIINETAARAFGWDDPVGKQIQVASAQNPEPITVIGVVRDFHIKSLHQKIEPLVMLARPQPSELWYASIRIRGDDIPGALAAIEQTWEQVFPDFPYEYSFLDDEYDSLYQNEQQLEQVFGAFALFSIFITCLGLFGLASFMAEQRTKEIGIRKVMGASIPNILMLLSRDFTILVLIAFVLATPLAYYFLNQWLQAFAYHIDLGVWTFALAGVGALLIAWATVGYQALKAAQSNPVDALQFE